MTVYRELLFDDDNLAELTRHNIAEANVIAVLQGDPKLPEQTRACWHQAHDRPRQERSNPRSAYN